LKALAAVALVLACARAEATLYTYTFSSGFANNGVIPDGNVAGWSDTRQISISGDDTILDVNVRLELSGGYNGDLYGYLVHGSGFAVLLNRVGRTSGNSFGYGDAGMAVRFDDQATETTDIHLYQTVSGYNISGFNSWRPDGRNVNPATVVDTDSRGALLGSFNNLAASGSWTLFLADMSSGEQSTVVSWGLDIEVVPEPVNVALGLFGGMVVLVGLGRHWWMRWQAGRV
jgi:subtilisin-like proprotein convertase family protein